MELNSMLRGGIVEWDDLNGCFICSSVFELSQSERP